MEMKWMIISTMSAFLLSAPGNAQPGDNDFMGHPGRPASFHDCCCCCCRPDRKPPHKGPGTSMLTDKLIKKLSLSDEQVGKWKKEEEAFRLKMEEMRPDKEGSQQLDPEEMRKKMDTMMQEHETSIRAILSEEQYKLYQKYKEENRPEKPEGGPEGPGGAENDDM